MPMLSMLSWHPEHAGLARCCARMSFWVVAVIVSVGKGGTLAGGAGGGAQSNWLRTKAPRLTTEVRVGYDVTASTPAMVKSPARWGVLRVVRVKVVPTA